jgi:hypothetical protein
MQSAPILDDEGGAAIITNEELYVIEHPRSLGGARSGSGDITKKAQGSDPPRE